MGSELCPAPPPGDSGGSADRRRPQASMSSSSRGSATESERPVCEPPCPSWGGGRRATLVGWPRQWESGASRAASQATATKQTWSLRTGPARLQPRRHTLGSIPARGTLAGHSSTLGGRRPPEPGAAVRGAPGERGPHVAGRKQDVRPTGHGAGCPLVPRPRESVQGRLLRKAPGLVV